MILSRKSIISTAARKLRPNKFSRITTLRNRIERRDLQATTDRLFGVFTYFFRHFYPIRRMKSVFTYARKEQG